MSTIAAKRIEFFATELAALGCKVSVERKDDGSVQVLVSSAFWIDTDNVVVGYTPGSAKGRKGARDSLHCMIFSGTRYPRKRYATVEYHEALRFATGLKSYTEHTHCEPGRHECGA